MKSTIYLKHDLYSLMDPKIMNVVREYDAVGYGLFWAVVEHLHKAETHKVEKLELISVLAFIFRNTNPDTISEFLTMCVEIGLFVMDGNLIYSERIIKTYQEQEEFSRKQAEYRRKGWEEKKKALEVTTSNLQATYTEAISDLIPIKEKEKEKEKNNKESIDNKNTDICNYNNIYISKSVSPSKKDIGSSNSNACAKAVNNSLADSLISLFSISKQKVELSESYVKNLQSLDEFRDIDVYDELKKLSLESEHNPKWRVLDTRIDLNQKVTAWLRKAVIHFNSPPNSKSKVMGYFPEDYKTQGGKSFKI